MIEGYRFNVKQRVRYQHVDFQGIVYYVRYIEWLESGRMEYLRNLGLTSRKMHNEGYDFVNVEVNCSYKKSAHLDDMVLVNTRLYRIGNSSFGFEYCMEDETTGNILVICKTSHVMVDNKTKRPIRVPDEYRALFTEFEGNNPTLGLKKGER